MPAPARPADVVEALVARSQREGPLSLPKLRAVFDEAGIGPAEARTVLQQLSEAGAVIGSDDKPARRRPAAKKAAAPAARKARPVKRGAVEDIPAGTSRSRAAMPAGRHRR